MTDKETKVVNPLWMPRNSVRAILTLIILATVWYLMFQNRAVHEYLQDAILMVMGYYFATRRAQGSVIKSSSEKKGFDTLWLPEGTIRAIILVGFVAITYILYKENRLFGNAKAFPMLLLIGGFFLGYLLKAISKRWQTKTNQNSIITLLSHAKAVLTISITLFFCLSIVFKKEPPSIDVARAFSTILGFYFGNR